MSQMFGEYLVHGQVIASTNYIFEQILGRGGNGTALLVRDPLLDRRIVLKVLDKVNSAEVVERFQLEGKILTRLEHRSIVKVHFAGPLVEAREGFPMRILPFLAMEYVEGETLGAKLRRDAPLSVPQALSMMAELLDGIDAAHQLGIIHRDIKPANVMVMRSTGALKLLDFGVAKVVEADQASSKQLTVAGTILGTPRYLSPEQAQATNVGPFTDIYSATVVLFEMLTGRTPFDGDIRELLYKHIYVTAPTLASTGCGGPFPSELEHLVAGQFAKDTTRRTQRAADLAAALRNIARQYTTTLDTGAAVRGDDPTLAIANPQAVFTDITTDRKVGWPNDRETVRDARIVTAPTLETTVEVTASDVANTPSRVPPRMVVQVDPAEPRAPVADTRFTPRPSRGRGALIALVAFLGGGVVVGVLIWGRGETGKSTKAATHDEATPVTTQSASSTSLQTSAASVTAPTAAPSPPPTAEASAPPSPAPPPQPTLSGTSKTKPAGAVIAKPTTAPKPDVVVAPAPSSIAATKTAAPAPAPTTKSTTSLDDRK